MGLCSSVVLELMEGLEFSGHQVYTDNFYTSPMLYLTLYNQGLDACGTTRLNRCFFPKELLTKASVSNRGHCDYQSNGPLLASVWVDKRTIYFFSSFQSAEPPATVKRRKLDGTRVNVACPSCLVDYLAYMRGVDRGDKLEDYYNIGRLTTRWWKKVFAYVIECCLLNSYVLDGHISPVEHARLGRQNRLLPVPGGSG